MDTHPNALQHFGQFDISAALAIRSLLLISAQSTPPSAKHPRLNRKHQAGRLEYLLAGNAVCFWGSCIRFVARLFAFSVLIGDYAVSRILAPRAVAGGLFRLFVAARASS